MYVQKTRYKKLVMFMYMRAQWVCLRALYKNNQPQLLLHRNSANSRKTGQRRVGLLQRRTDDCRTIDTSERACNEVGLLLRWHVGLSSASRLTDGYTGTEQHNTTAQNNRLCCYNVVLMYTWLFPPSWSGLPSFAEVVASFFPALPSTYDQHADHHNAHQTDQARKS